MMLLSGIFIWFRQKQVRVGQILSATGLYIFTYDLVNLISQPIASFSRSIPRGFWSNAIFQFSDYLKVVFQLPPVFLAILLVFGAVILLQKLQGSTRLVMAVIGLTITAALCFSGQPLALVGSPFIILAAFAVRSLPASVRAGVAALQQIDPSMEEASQILGADAQYTFRKVTLPLILPAFLAGLIFSFTRHMTSLSAIIFLVSARWRIVTASILSEWEQGGVSIAAAYSTVIIVFVMIAIGILYFITNRVMKGRTDVDLSIGL
jgi:iron(III) transport system permease protein